MWVAIVAIEYKYEILKKKLESNQILKKKPKCKTNNTHIYIHKHTCIMFEYLQNKDNENQVLISRTLDKRSEGFSRIFSPRVHHVQRPTGTEIWAVQTWGFLHKLIAQAAYRILLFAFQL